MGAREESGRERASLLARRPAGGMLLGYTVMLAATVGLFVLIRHEGASLVAPPAPAGARVHPETASHDAGFAHVLLAIAVVVVVARLVGVAFDRWLRQPPVMGEIVAGLMLGPSVLGAIWPEAQAFLLPASVAPQLGTIAKLGVMLFMFLVGLELDPRVLRGSSHATLAISHASIIAPFLLGATLALGIYPLYSHAGVDFTVFALFIGVSMSVTAFPVLARILTDRRMQRSALGVTALACAAVDDATAWCLLAFVSGVATARLDGAWLTIVLVAAYVAFVVIAVRPFLGWLARREERTSDPVSLTVLALVLGALLLSAVATEAIGIHALFGAFLFGAVIPHDGRLAEQLRARLADVVVVLLLPIFFAFTGMRTEIGLVSSPADWLVCGVIVLVATLGKFGGTLVAARMAGLGWRDASALGTLMNTRGLMELVVLNVGLDMGVLSPTLFAMLVLMALVTTFTTTPVLERITRPGRSEPRAPVALPIDHS